MEMGVTRLGAAARRMRSRTTRIAVSVFAVGLVAILWILRAPLFGNNFHEVISASVFRSAQLDPGDLDAAIDEHGLRSVVSLRFQEHDGGVPGGGERGIAAARGVDFHLVPLGADRLLSRQRLRELIHVLDTAKRPMLIHCRNGTDRTGLAAALVVLLAGQDTRAARAAFALRFGHPGPLSPSDLSEWIDLYERWLDDEGRATSAENLRAFAATGYTPYHYDARLEPIDVPAVFEAGRHHFLRFRVTNTSPRALDFARPLPEGEPGVLFGAQIVSAADESLILEARGRTTRQRLAPGESVELDITLPPIPKPGTYHLLVDLVDEVWFYQMGSTPFRLDVDAREPEARS